MIDTNVYTEAEKRFPFGRAEALRSTKNFYHGTQESKLKGIMRKGLQPSSYEQHEKNYEISNGNSVYITTELESARDWARWNADEGEKWFVLEIPREVVLMELFDSLLPDDNLWFHYDSWRLEDVIVDPKHLSVVEVGEKEY